MAAMTQQITDTHTGFGNYQLRVAKTESILSHIIGRLARCCARHPLATLVITTAVLMAACCGTLTMTIDTSDNVWYDPKSNATQNVKLVESLYPELPRVDRLLVYAKDGGSVLRKAVWDEMFELTEDVKGIVVPKDRSPTGVACAFDAVCVTAGAACLQEGVTGFFKHDFDTYKSRVSSDTDILAAVRATRWPEGGPVHHRELFGALELDGDGLPTGAGALRVSWRTRGECAAAWEQEYHRFFMQEQRIRVSKTFKHIEVQISAEASGADEIERSVYGDKFTIYAVFILMFVVTVMLLGSPPCLPPLSLVRQRSLLAFMEIFMVGLAIGAGYGISFQCGVPFTMLAQVLPFVLLGIGLDNAFIITSALDAIDERVPFEHRISLAMGRVGVSITFTSLTDILAFGFGYMSRLPAVQHFCVMGIWSLTFIYFFHITGFVALLALDSSRQSANRWDLVPCFKASKPAPRLNQSLSRRIVTVLARIVMQRTCVRLMVLLAFAASFGVSMNTLLHDLPTGFDLMDLVPEQSFLRDMYTKEQDFFGVPSCDDNIPASVYLWKQPVHSAWMQAQVLNVASELQSLSTIRADKNVSFWLAEWSQYVEVKRKKTVARLGDDFPDAVEHDLEGVVQCSPTCKMYYVGDRMLDSIKDWLSFDFVDAKKRWENGTEFVPSRAWGGKRFQGDVVFNANRDEIESFRFHAYHEHLRNGNDQIRALNEVEGFYSSNQERFPGMVIVSPAYRMFDQHRIILPELLDTFGFVCVAVVVVSPFILIHPVSVMLVATVLVMTFVNLFASLRWWGLEVNSLTGVILVCSIGLVVDYCAHICHSFSIQDRSLSRSERAVAALFEIGAPVAVGVLTTGLSMVPLAFAISETYRTFYKIGISMCVIGGLHGLVFCPVLLSFIGPKLSRRAMRYHDETTCALGKLNGRTAQFHDDDATDCAGDCEESVEANAAEASPLSPSRSAQVDLPVLLSPSKAGKGKAGLEPAASPDGVFVEVSSSPSPAKARLDVEQAGGPITDMEQAGAPGPDAQAASPTRRRGGAASPSKGRGAAPKLSTPSRPFGGGLRGGRSTSPEPGNEEAAPLSPSAAAWVASASSPEREGVKTAEWIL